MQDNRVRLDGRGRAPFLPRRAKQDEWRVSAVDVHRDRTATRTANDHIGLVLIVFGLSGADRQPKVVVIEGRVDERVAVVAEIGWFDAARNAVPAVEKQDLHHAFIQSSPV